MRKPQAIRSDGKITPAKPSQMLQLLGLTAGLTWSLLGNALGMGGINVVSALGQPLKAEIELVAVDKADKPGLVARLASPDAYKGAGLDYPYGVKYTFQVSNRANGDTYLKLSSNQEINDPFVSLLVELSWSSGKLMREYTFLLDPPGYVAVQPKAVAQASVMPAAVESAPLPVIVKKIEEPREFAGTPVAKPAARVVEKRQVAAPVKHEAEAANVSTGSITVKRGDSLNKIAAQNKPGDISLERMLVALYRVNANQFDGSNMNRIKTGKILRLPDQDELAKLAQTEAVQEIHAQSEDWNVYRQKLASAATSSRQTEAPRQVATGKITAPVADKAPVASESAKEVLRLSKGEAPGDKAGTAGKAKKAQDKRNADAEDAIAKAKAVSEEKTRAALLESNLKDMQRLAKLKLEAAALANAAASKVAAASVVEAAAKIASAVAAASEVAAASSVLVASEVAAVSSVAAASEVVAASQVAAASAVKPAPVVVEEPSLIDQLLNSPFALGIGAAALLALGGLGIAFSRRKQAAGKADKSGEELGATTGHLTSPVVPSPDTGDFTAPHSLAVEVAPQPDDVDPISEADLFLNFGRDEQAEEVLKDALLREPDNNPVRLKLLGIYAKRQDADAFARVAAHLEGSADLDAQQQVAEMAKTLEPANGQDTDAEMVEPSDSATLLAALDAEPETDTEKASVAVTSEDLDVADDSALDSALDMDFPLSFDASTTQPMAIPAEVKRHELAQEIDFDVTSTHPMATPPDVVDFDVTATIPSLAASEMLDFDLAEPKADLAAEEHHEDEAMPNLDDLIFDVMASQEPAVKAEAASVSPVEAAATEEDNGMEFMLDFPMDDIKEKAAPQAPSINLSDISLEMDDVAAPVVAADSDASGVKSEHWHEVATKLDLAKAYQEMGDDVGAREILDEVMIEGDNSQQQEAQLLIKQLG